MAILEIKETHSTNINQFLENNLNQILSTKLKKMSSKTETHSTITMPIRFHPKNLNKLIPNANPKQ
jgi:hypothetical protein